MVRVTGGSNGMPTTEAGRRGTVSCGTIATPRPASTRPISVETCCTSHTGRGSAGNSRQRLVDEDAVAAGVRHTHLVPGREFVPAHRAARTEGMVRCDMPAR